MQHKLWEIAIDLKWKAGHFPNEPSREQIFFCDVSTEYAGVMTNAFVWKPGLVENYLHSVVDPRKQKIWRLNQCSAHTGKITLISTPLLLFEEYNLVLRYFKLYYQWPSIICALN